MLGAKERALLLALSETEYCTSGTLAKALGVSSKTAQSMVKDLREKLQENGADILARTRHGYLLQVNAEPGAFLYYGFRQPITREEFARRIEDNTLPEVLNAVPVCKGDCFYIPSGTVHAIGKGILIAEVQQNSDVTYRVYDYDRRDATGKPRQLHTEQAEDVAKRTPPRDDYNFGGHLIRCEYFTVDRMTGSFTDVCDDESFTSLVILDGNGTLIGENEKIPLRKGDSFFLPANSGSYRVEGNTVILKTRVGTI